MIPSPEKKAPIARFLFKAIKSIANVVLILGVVMFGIYMLIFIPKEKEGDDIAHNMEKVSIPLIDALDRYRGDTGKYPETLDNLPPQYLPKIPHCEPDQSGPVHNVRYRYVKEGESFELICQTWGMHLYIYKSKTKKWFDYDG